MPLAPYLAGVPEAFVQANVFNPPNKQTNNHRAQGPIAAGWASPDKQSMSIEEVITGAGACSVCEQVVRIPSIEGGEVRCDTPKTPSLDLPDVPPPKLDPPKLDTPKLDTPKLAPPESPCSIGNGGVNCDTPNVPISVPGGVSVGGGNEGGILGGGGWRGRRLGLLDGVPEVDIPCSASAPSVTTDELTMCEAATKFPNIVAPGLSAGKVTEAIDKGQRMCPCLKELPKYLSDFSVADFRTAATAGASELFDCLTTRGLDIKDNTADVERSGPLSEAGGDKIIRAPEVGMKLYMSMATSGGLCISGVASECTTVISHLVNYFKDAASTVGGGLAD